MYEVAQRVIFGEGKWWWIRHSAFWIFVYLDLILGNILVPPESLDSYGFDVLSLLLDVAVVYINIYYLMPNFLFKRKVSTYVLLTLLTLLANVVILVLSSSIYYEEQVYPEEFLSVFLTTLTLFMTAVAIKLGKYYYHQLQVTRELKTSQAQLEINSLKEQINPHFLFNVLNTIHIQSKTEPDTVSDTVHHLSNLLRYQIYEAGESDTVLLSKEVSFLKNYIDLEQLRRDNLEVSWQLAQDIPRIKVKPFLFLPLIENALKHSRKIDGSPTILQVNWQYEKNNLGVIVTNTIGDANTDKPGGFGIDNLKKRLSLLYPDRYNLSLSSKEGLFEAKLQIQVDESDHH